MWKNSIIFAKDCKMNINYLTWIKDLNVSLHDRKDCHQLLASDIHEPLELLKEHITLYQDQLWELQQYNNDWGHPVLIKNIGKRYGVKSQNVYLSNGASNAIFLVSQTLLQKGDRVIVEDPVYEPLWASAEFLGARIIWISRDPPTYRIDPDKLGSLITTKTKLVVLTNLHNPSGAHLTDQELKDIAEIAKWKNPAIKILVDEIYKDFVPCKPKPAAKIDPCFITISSLSKVYGLTHLQCGFIIASSRIIEQIRKHYVLVEGSGSRYLESLSALIFEHLDEYLNRTQKIVSENRKICCSFLEPMIEDRVLSGNIPENGCIYFPKIKGIKNTDAFVKKLAKRFKVYVVPGKFFGDNNRVRIGFGGKTEDLKISLGKLVEGITSLL